MKPSSTSSSEAGGLRGGEKPLPPAGFPWAVALALALLALVEGLVRVAEARGFQPYAPGAAEYRTVRNIVETRGPADVGFLGSSNGRESIVTPLVQEWLDGRSAGLTAANYSVAGAGASELHAIARFLGRAGSLELLVFVVTPRVMVNYMPHDAERALFLDLDDWNELQARDAATAESVRSVLVRNQLDRAYRTLRYRMYDDVLWHWLRYRSVPRPPAAGAPSAWHVESPEKTLDPIDRRDVEARLARQGSEPGSILDFSPEKRDVFAEALDAAVRASRHVVVVEVPVSPALFEAYTDARIAVFRTDMSEITRSRAIPYWTLDDLDLGITQADFRDISHLNYAGARKYTGALIEQVLAPLLEDRNR